VREDLRVITSLLLMDGLAQLVLERSRVHCQAYEGALFRYATHHIRSLPSTLERSGILYLGKEGQQINATHRRALEGAGGVCTVRDLRMYSATNTQLWINSTLYIFS
jgi:hypothetical protein